MMNMKMYGANGQLERKLALYLCVISFSQILSVITCNSFNDIRDNIANIQNRVHIK